MYASAIWIEGRELIWWFSILRAIFVTILIFRTHHQLENKRGHWTPNFIDEFYQGHEIQLWLLGLLIWRRVRRHLLFFWELKSLLPNIHCCHWKKPAVLPSEVHVFMRFSMRLSWLLSVATSTCILRTYSNFSLKFTNNNKPSIWELYNFTKLSCLCFCMIENCMLINI